MYQKRTFLMLLASLCCIPAFAQFPDVKRTYMTERIQDRAPIIDGYANDPTWDQVDWSGNFVQRTPEDSTAPSQQTAFKILYDAKNLYVLIRAFDTEPEKVVSRMSRRDGFEGDWVEINIDSRNDKRTAFSFTASASGVKSDEYISDNGNNWDENWDPIWYLRTSLDSKGWMAEMRIPLSQLRFDEREDAVWGIQVTRMLFRKEERSHWTTFPNDQNGWIHFFGELRGLKGIKPQKQVEIQPYVSAQIETSEAQVGNPFATGREQGIAAGVDGKIGLTSNITLDFTINPDFGQVEADPSQVNLTAYQVFFSERRPFFIEGNELLTFAPSQSEAGGFFNSDNLFYSRRIGRRPQTFPRLADGEHVRMPDNTSILGAVKLTGKNAKGFSWAVLESVTDKEEAEIDLNGERRKETVEPLTNYLVGRVQKEWNQSNTILGGIFTAVNRKIDEPQLDFLRSDAYSGGIDFQHNWKDRKYYISFKGLISNVQGSTRAILRTQRASERFFQRPDATYLGVDTSLTELSGTSGELSFGRRNGSIIYQTGITWRSPGFEINDVGFLQRADHINQWSWAQWRKLQPFSIFRSFRWNVNEYFAFDFGGTNTYRAFNTNMHMEFKNQWRIGTGSTIEDRFVANGELRGGPTFIMPGGINHWYYISSNSSKKLYFFFNNWRYWGNENSAYSEGYSVNITYQPFNAFRISLNPNLNFRRSDLQYVSTINSNGSDKYILARIDQETYNFSFRLSYNITPNLDIQYWGQPFVAKGIYSQFKKVKDPDAKSLADRTYTFSDQEIAFEEGSYRVDLDEDGIVEYDLGNPNFDFAQFRHNLVLRWEYIPGSTFFLVWSQDRTGSLSATQSTWRNFSQGLWDIQPSNIFLVKFAYRFRN